VAAALVVTVAAATLAGRGWRSVTVRQSPPGSAEPPGV